MQTVYDSKGNPHTLNPIDARERIACGQAWATREAALAANPEPVVLPPAPAGDTLTVLALREWLKANGVTHHSTADKAELVALYDAAQLPKG